jgi:hypothetical protein
MPTPHLDEEHRAVLDRAVCADPAWQVAEPHADADHEPGVPVLHRQWRHTGGASLLLVVLGWYPLVVTVGAGNGPLAKVRRVERTLVDAVVAAGGRVVADADLDGVLDLCRQRWERAVAARQVIERQRTWLECRQCAACGAWSAYGVVHCRGCRRRFAPADDAQRDERGRAAAEVVAAAERELAALGRGEGIFPDWPSTQVPTADRQAPPVSSEPTERTEPPWSAPPPSPHRPAPMADAS